HRKGQKAQMKRIFTWVMIIAALIAGGLNAQTNTEDKRWRYIGSTGSADVYVDCQTVRRTGDSVTVWERFTDRNGQGYSLQRYEIRSGWDRIGALYVYDADGKMTASSANARSWAEWVPGSIQEKINNFFFPPPKTPTMRY